MTFTNGCGRHNGDQEFAANQQIIIIGRARLIYPTRVCSFLAFYVSSCFWYIFNLHSPHFRIRRCRTFMCTKRLHECMRECNIYYNDAHVADKLLVVVVHKCRLCLRNIYSVRFTLLFRIGGAPQHWNRWSEKYRKKIDDRNKYHSHLPVHLFVLWFLQITKIPKTFNHLRLNNSLVHRHFHEGKINNWIEKSKKKCTQCFNKFINFCTVYSCIFL